MNISKATNISNTKGTLASRAIEIMEDLYSRGPTSRSGIPYRVLEYLVSEGYVEHVGNTRYTLSEKGEEFYTSLKNSPDASLLHTKIIKKLLSRDKDD